MTDLADPTRIFICYKKRDREDRDNSSAYTLYQFLKTVKHYDVWMDENIDAGSDWEKEIYERLLPSDVMLLAIIDGTHQSDWVRREISLATSFGITIIPVGLGITQELLNSELVRLNLPHLQFKRPHNMEAQSAKAIVNDLEPAILRARNLTRSGNHKLINAISGRIVPPKPKIANPKLSADFAVVKFPHGNLTVHISSGDIFELSGFDILINSENDYMQMARKFDMNSMSASIRFLGGAKERGIYQDTIQLEIEKKIAEFPRPVPAGTFFTTSSGGPSSDLFSRYRTTHIVHVAAVNAQPNHTKINHLSAAGDIKMCVTSALLGVQEICRANGVVSPEGTAQRRLQEAQASSFRPKRMLLPLFGTGRGGQDPKLIAPIVLTALMDFFTSPHHEPLLMPISDIHLSAFHESDVETLKDALKHYKGMDAAT